MKIKPIVSSLILVCFVLNSAVADLGFAQTSLQPKQANLATPSQCDDLAGIQHKDIGRIKLALEAQLEATAKMRADGMPVSLSTFITLIKEQFSTDRTIFRPAGIQLFFNEVRLTLNGIRIMCRVKDENGLRTYYALFLTHRDANGGFPIEVYTENEYKRLDLNAKDLPHRKTKDADAIKRYIEQNEKIIDDFIRERVEAGDFTEIEGRTEALNWDQKYPDRKRPGVYVPSEMLGLIKKEFDTFLGYFGSSFDTALAGKNIVFIKIPEDKDFPRVNMNGKSMPVFAHASQNAVYVFLDDRDFDWLNTDTPINISRKALMRTICSNLIHEIGVSYGLPFKIEKVMGTSFGIRNALDHAYMEYKTDGGMNKETGAYYFENWQVEMLLAKYPEMAMLKGQPVDLDTNLQTRDYAAGFGGAQSDIEQILRRQVVSFTFQDVQAISIDSRTVIEKRKETANITGFNISLLGQVFTVNFLNFGKGQISLIVKKMSKSAGDSTVAMNIGATPSQISSLLDDMEKRVSAQAARTLLETKMIGMPPYYIGLSMGGTKLYAALYKRGSAGLAERIEERSIIWQAAFNLNDPTEIANPAKVSPDAIVAKTAEVIFKLLSDHGLTVKDLNNVGCTSPGPLDEREGIIGLNAKTFNLPFEKYPFVSKLSKVLGMPYVEINHDAHSGLSGELAQGALVGVKNGYYVIQGTGLGGSMAVKGKYHTAIPELTEPGHHIVGQPIDGSPYYFHFRFIFKYGKDHPYEVVEKPDPLKAHQITRKAAAELLASGQYERDDLIWIVDGEQDFEDTVAGLALKPMLRDKVKLAKQFGSLPDDYNDINKPEDLSEVALSDTTGGWNKSSARAIIKYLAGEVGKGLAALIATSYGKPWQLERISIGSTVGEKMGINSKGQMLTTASGEDFYYHYIREAAKKELIEHFKLPAEFAESIAKQIVRSPITQDVRETAGFDRSAAQSRRSVRHPGKSPEDALMVIALELRDKKPFTLADYIKAYRKVQRQNPQLGFERLAKNPETTARRDLEALYDQSMLFVYRDGVHISYQLTLEGVREAVNRLGALAALDRLAPNTASQPRNPDGTFKEQPGKSPQDAFKVIINSPYLYDILLENGYFTLTEYIEAYREEAPRLGFDRDISDDTARDDLRGLRDLGDVEIDESGIPHLYRVNDRIMREMGETLRLRRQAEAISRSAGEIPTAAVGKSATLSDLAPHALVNALIEFAVFDNEYGPAEDFVEKMPDQNIWWLGGAKGNNRSFLDIFNWLVSIEAKKRGKNVATFEDEMALCRRLVEKAGLKESIMVNLGFIADLKQKLSLQVEHFGVRQGKYYIMKAYKINAHNVLQHARLERDLHRKAIRIFHAKDFDAYLRWRREGTQLPINIPVGETGLVINGTMSYNAFAQQAHEIAERLYTVSSLPAKSNERSQRFPEYEIPTAAVNSSDVPEITSMVVMAGQVGIEVAPPVQDYTIFTSYGFCTNDELDKDKKDYGSRFGLEKILTQRSDEVADWVLKRIVDKNLDPRNVIVQLHKDFSQPQYEGELQKLVAKGIKYMIIDTNGLKDEKEEASRKDYRRNIYCMMLLARKIDKDAGPESKLYQLLKFFIESHLGDAANNAAMVDQYIEGLKKNELVKMILSYKPIERYRLPEYRMVAATLISA